MAAIVGLVADRGSIRRCDLIDAMVSLTFPHPKARPSDRSWCQGYVAGAIRNGFLAVAGTSGNHAGEASATPGESSAKSGEL
jgi:hypothetical protein